MSAAAAQRTIETIEREIVLAKESYVAVVAAEAIARAKTYIVAYNPCKAASYDFDARDWATAHANAYEAVKLAETRLWTLSDELAALRAR